MVLMKIVFSTLNHWMGEVGEKVSFGDGREIIRQGQHNKYFYYIKEGSVLVYRENQIKAPLAFLYPGEYFGEITCLLGEPARATYMASGDVVLLRTTREGLLTNIQRVPEFSRNIVETLAGIIKSYGSQKPLAEGQPQWAKEGAAAVAEAVNPGSNALAAEGAEGEDSPQGLQGADRAEGKGQCITGAESKCRPAVGLALGSGSIRGMAHIGVARVLWENKIPVDFIAGTSAGALVGACLAAGMKPEDLADIVKGLRWSKIASPVWPPGKAFLRNDRLGQLLEEKLGSIRIEDLSIPLAVVATDALTGEEVVIREGDLALAVRASTAIPAIFEPVEMDGRLLVDGATVNMLPSGICRYMGADLVIGVSVNDFTFESGPPKNVAMAMLHYLDMMLKKQHDLSRESWADITIRVKGDGAGGYQFRQSRQFIREGEKAAWDMMPRIKSLIRLWK